ncbi:MAG TPA: hypothetical protein PKY88_12855 [Anaerohalosphaeraceae bacterium]|nr:hypothetical protein [Anaerohalosphaeraceae bacterium]
MSQSLKKVKPGDKLQIPAAVYNAFVDAALDFRSRQHNVQTPTGGWTASEKVKIKNNSGTDAARFQVLGIDGVLFDPQDALQTFQQEVVLLGNTPLLARHAGGRFVICASPIPNGTIGTGWGSGICPVQVNVTDESHGYADVADGQAAYLASAESGPCTILWKESGTGIKWAVVRFGGSGGDKPECFLLTDLSQNPMQGTHQVLGEGWLWVDGSYGSVQILCHPASQLDNYRLSYVWAQKVSGIWVAISMTNIPVSICSS